MLALPSLAGLALAASTATATPDVETFVAEALESHPSVTAAQRRAVAATYRVEPAGAWDDPMLNVGVMNLPYDPLSLSATPMSGVEVGLSQRIPWPGKRALAEDVARAAAAVAEEGVEEQKNQLGAAVRMVYYDIHLLDVSKVVLERNVSIFDRFIAIADTKYEVGKGLQQDVLRARIARDKLEEQLLAIERQREAEEARMSSLLARDEPLAVPPLLDVPVSQLEPSLAVRPLLEIAEQERPKLRALARAVEGQEAAAALADKAALPDVGVSLSYRFRADVQGDPSNGADFLGFGLSVPLPVFYGSKQGPAAEAAYAEVTAKTAEIDVLRLEIQDAVERALRELPRLEAQMAKFEDAIIPRTQQTLEADLVAYQVDRVDFLDLLDIEMNLVRYQIDFHRLHVAHEKLIVRIAEALGVSPDRIAEPGPTAHVHGAKP